MKQAERFEAKRFETPDEHNDFPHGRSDVVTVGDTRVIQVTFEPGFRWSEAFGTPGAERCPYEHRLHIVSGTLGLQWPDGTERMLRPGDTAYLAPQHESWTVGDEPVVFLDFIPNRG